MNDSVTVAEVAVAGIFNSWKVNPSLGPITSGMPVNVTPGGETDVSVTSARSPEGTEEVVTVHVTV